MEETSIGMDEKRPQHDSFRENELMPAVASYFRCPACRKAVFTMPRISSPTCKQCGVLMIVDNDAPQPTPGEG